MYKKEIKEPIDILFIFQLNYVNQVGFNPLKFLVITPEKAHAIISSLRQETVKLASPL